jgi:hypothetical protein
MNTLFKGMKPDEILKAAVALTTWEKDYRKIKPFQKVKLDKKWELWNTKAGNVTVTKLLMLLLLPFISLSQSDNRAASDLWKVVSEKAGLKKNLVIKTDSSISEGGYRISADTIYHRSISTNPGAVYAVARIAEELWDAIMIRPGNDGIIIQRPGPWRDLEISYTPTLVRANMINRSIDAASRTWLHWHHFPTKGSLDSTFWHQSWFIGLCLKYPQLAPPSGAVNEHTKPNVMHPDFPKIMHAEWVARGRPNHCNLFEIDGTQFWWMNNHYTPPAYLNLAERERFPTSISQSIKPTLAVGTMVRASDGKRYPITENFFIAFNAVPNQNKYPKSTNYRANYTAFYLDAFTKVKRYFDLQGDSHVIFNMLAYGGYRCLPEGDWDLSRFHVYYTSPGANAWEWEEMILDSREFVKWKRAGAKVIWRPNFILRPQNRLIYNLITTYIQITQPDGYQIPTYTVPTWPLGNGIDIYATMRAIQDKPYFDYFKHVPEGYMLWHNQMLFRDAVKSDKDEDDL